MSRPCNSSGILVLELRHFPMDSDFVADEGDDPLRSRGRVAVVIIKCGRLDPTPRSSGWTFIPPTNGESRHWFPVFAEHILTKGHCWGSRVARI